MQETITNILINEDHNTGEQIKKLDELYRNDPSYKIEQVNIGKHPKEDKVNTNPYQFWWGV